MPGIKNNDKITLSLEVAATAAKVDLSATVKDLSTFQLSEAVRNNLIDQLGIDTTPTTSTEIKEYTSTGTSLEIPSSEKTTCFVENAGSNLLVLSTEGSSTLNGIVTFPLPAKHWANLLYISADDNYRVFATQAVGIVAPNVLPVSDFTFSSVGLTTTFIDTSTDSDGTIASWFWTFEDGSTQTIQNPVYVNATAGTFDASLVVTDNDGGVSPSETKSYTVSAVVASTYFANVMASKNPTHAWMLNDDLGATSAASSVAGISSLTTTNVTFGEASGFSANNNLFKSASLGLTSTLTLPHESSLDLGDSGTYSFFCVFKHTSTTSGIAFVLESKIDPSTARGIQVYIGSSGQLQARVEDSNGTVESLINSQIPDVRNDGLWHSAFVTIDLANNAMVSIWDGNVANKATRTISPVQVNVDNTSDYLLGDSATYDPFVGNISALGRKIGGAVWTDQDCIDLHDAGMI